jgi:hypothetical protein
VLSQRGRGGQRLIYLPLPGVQPPPQVGGHGLGWALWATWWHILIIPLVLTLRDLHALLLLILLSQLP